jgi:hypothetical protein
MIMLGLPIGSSLLSHLMRISLIIVGSHERRHRFTTQVVGDD